MQSITSFFSHFTLVDSLLCMAFAFCAFEGYALGGVLAVFDLIKFVTSFLIGLKCYGFVATLLVNTFHMSKGYANALGFFIAALIAEIAVHFLLAKVIKKANNHALFTKSGFGQLNNIIGIFPGLLSGMVLLMFILTVLITLPVSPFLKGVINNSKIGSFLVSRSQVIEREIAGAFGGAGNDTVSFLTVEPKSDQSVSLGFSVSSGAIDASAENSMITMLNHERANRGQSALTVDNKLRQLARDYAESMLSRGYFSHYTPEGLSPFDRMQSRDILFSYAGENLAFSPNVDLAMQGLMNSPGHKANILSADFHRVGIGVIDAGIYGEMFVQEFTD